MSVTLASFRALRAPAVGSHQYFYELRDQFAKVTDYLYLCSNSAALQTGRLRRLGVTAEVRLSTCMQCVQGEGTQAACSLSSSRRSVVWESGWR